MRKQWLIEVRRPEVAIHEMARTGHMTGTQSRKLIAARLAKRGVVL